ncbi:hypothetical protein wTpre_8 [Wolbachia endosymbiont of Trichogramma pretiosum]|nr:hypothetical protein wTpre_8 [Wolbachia endosymbiont of Trichogramma pretiosum]
MVNTLQPFLYKRTGCQYLALGLHHHKGTSVSYLNDIK